MVLRQLYLRLRVRRSCSSSENIKDQPWPIEYRYTQHFLQIPLLRWGEFIVKDHGIRCVFLDPCLYFIQFATPDIIAPIGSLQSLRETLQGLDVCCRCKEFQLIQVFLELLFILLRSSPRTPTDPSFCLAKGLHVFSDSFDLLGCKDVLVWNHVAFAVRDH